MAKPILDRKTILRYPGLLTLVARQEGITLGHLSRVACGERRSPRLERALQRALRHFLRAFPDQASDRVA